MAEAKNVYQIVTDRIITELQAGTIPWRKPWAGAEHGAFNRITRKPYSFLNQLLLKHDGEYASLQQWNSLGGIVRKGEKSEVVVFWKKLENKEPDSTDENSEEVKDEKPKYVLRYYRVFHVSQVDGVKPLELAKRLRSATPDAEAEAVFRNYLDLTEIRFEDCFSDEAYYSPSQDLIHLPLMSQFQDASEYYSTAFHEAIHSTGHANRLNREGVKKVSFGSNTYSKEELVAETGASFLCHILGIGTESSVKNSASYIQGWLNVLKRDARLIVSAAGQAEKAVRYILDCSQFDDKLRLLSQCC